MSRLGRYAFNLLTLISFAFFVGVLVIWPRGAGRIERYSWVYDASDKTCRREIAYSVNWGAGDVVSCRRETDDLPPQTNPDSIAIPAPGLRAWFLPHQEGGFQSYPSTRGALDELLGECTHAGFRNRWDGWMHSRLRLAWGNWRDEGDIIAFSEGPVASANKKLSYWAAPCWLLAIVTGFFPFMHLIVRWKQKARRRPGHCRDCGYDLRATPDRCPECGLRA